MNPFIHWFTMWRRKVVGKIGPHKSSNINIYQPFINPFKTLATSPGGMVHHVSSCFPWHQPLQPSPSHFRAAWCATLSWPFAAPSAVAAKWQPWHRKQRQRGGWWTWGPTSSVDPGFKGSSRWPFWAGYGEFSTYSVSMSFWCMVMNEQVG